MEDYDYYLEDNATEYYKELYNNLKDILKEEEINDEEYAKIVSKLFITDLFTLNNKVTSSDIGGLQFIHNDFKEDFINIAKTTIYSTYLFVNPAPSAGHIKIYLSTSSLFSIYSIIAS